MLLSICLPLLISTIGYAQGKDAVLKRRVYTVVDELPEPEGGNEKLVAVLAKKVKEPSTCEVPRSTVISFIVEADGKIDGYQVIRDPCGEKHPLADAMFTNVYLLRL